MGSSAPFVTQTATSLSYDPNISHLGVNTVQEAIDKLAWLMSLNPLIDEDGNVNVKIGTPISSLTLFAEADSNIKYFLSVDDQGELVATLQDLDAPIPLDNYKIFRKPNGSTARPGINESGETIIEDSLPSFGPVVNKIFLKSPNESIWMFGITDLNEVVTMSGEIEGGWFRVSDLDNRPLFSVHSQNKLGFNYLPIFNSTNLPLMPDQDLVNNVPWAFFENDNAEKRPIYYDGAVWKYFSSNLEVI